MVMTILTMAEEAAQLLAAAELGFASCMVPYQQQRTTNMQMTGRHGLFTADAYADPE
jgi:hypothetical protein